MKFSTQEDINAPADAVFEMLCDFVSFEQAAMRRGAEVQRVDSMTTPGRGMMWHAAFNLRGKRRQLSVEMAKFDRPTTMVLDSTSQGIAGKTVFDLIALSPQRTRLKVELELTPQNLSSRLMVQSLKLAKNTLTKRFKLRVADYAQKMETKHRGQVHGINRPASG